MYVRLHREATANNGPLPGTWITTVSFSVAPTVRRPSIPEPMRSSRSIRLRVEARAGRKKGRAQAKYASSSGIVVPVELPEANVAPVSKPNDGDVEGAPDSTGGGGLEDGAVAVSGEEAGMLEAGHGGGPDGVAGPVAKQQEQVDW